MIAMPVCVLHYTGPYQSDFERHMRILLRAIEDEEVDEKKERMIWFYVKQQQFKFIYASELLQYQN